jgi:hypothetical protein
VIPDVEVALTRAQLLQGNDSQLMAAIKHLKMDKQGVHHHKGYGAH